MKKIVIINGSPRLNGNTAKLTYAFAQELNPYWMMLKS